MLKDKIKVVIRDIGGTNKAVSVYAGLAAPNVGKLTNGSRVPAKTSSTAEKLVNGIYAYSQENRKVSQLCKTIGCSQGSEKKIKEALLDWLYEDVPRPSDGADVFAERFNKLMDITHTTSREICLNTGADISLINRFCEGDRLPTRRARLINGICVYFAEKSIENGTAGEIAALVGIAEKDMSEINAAPLIRDWLFGDGDSAHSVTAAQIIKNILQTEPPYKRRMPALKNVMTESVLNDTRQQYIGINGLQQAVLRFLSDAIANKSRELILYSDQSMEWMQESYTPKWLTLMNECLKNGTRIKIVHNIDRESYEMLFAVRNWMPLYMTGLIEPYYRIDSSGSRFCHTVFISDTAAVFGYCPVLSERSCIYSYSAGREATQDVRKAFSHLFSRIKPLLRYESGEFKPAKLYKSYDLDEVRIYVSDRDAVVYKLVEPLCSFRFTHPFLVRVFSLYARSFGKVEANENAEEKAKPKAVKKEVKVEAKTENKEVKRRGRPRTKKA